MPLGRQKIWLYVLVVPSLILFYKLWASQLNLSELHPESWTKPTFNWPHVPGQGNVPPKEPEPTSTAPSRWQTITTRYPVTDMRPLPTGKALALPKIQKEFRDETEAAKKTRQERKKVVKDAFLRCWNSYKSLAWTADELTPVTGKPRNVFGGWGATLVDSLDTLWIMGLHDDFHQAVVAAANISFETTAAEEVNVFETTIRYLGGFLSAYDLSGDERLLSKAREVGDMLYAAFDTPNRMPITRWNMHKAADGAHQIAPDLVLVAEIGSLTMEFTRLSLLTGDPKWFDAVQRIMEHFEKQQMTGPLPGMWGLTVNAKSMEFNRDNRFTLGAMSDSLYEYLPKMYALVGGQLSMYQRMYESAMTAAMTYTFYRPMVPDEKNLLIPAFIETKSEGGETKIEMQALGQHLGCFVGGMLAVGGKIFPNDYQLAQAEKLVDGCTWAYAAMPLGIMPESFYMMPCKTNSTCKWNETVWKEEVARQSGEVGVDAIRADEIITAKRLPKGFTRITDSRYVLRPEAIESVFILYRVTGRPDLLDTAWTMFEAIQNNTRTALANSALDDVTMNDSNSKSDSMESFWLGETLKYFYLIFSDASTVSLDEYVFNTEAHPFKRLLPHDSHDPFGSN
jgi:mannosyl-oligosaccharide alpha-1,2-mannosidase